MKREIKHTIIIVLVAIALCFADSVWAQNVTKDAAGNYHAIASYSDSGKVTNQLYFDSKNVSYPIYQTAKGKLFIKRVSKTSGREYRFYLSTEPKKL